MENPCVSVIIPTYNREGFLSSAIQSVLDQSYKNIEVIVVDDGSTDDTKKAIAFFKNKIRYFYTEHKGAAHARNVGMEVAQGKYIAFLDSDDEYLPWKTEVQVNFMKTHPEIKMVYTEFSGNCKETGLEEFHLRSYHGTYNYRGWKYEDIYMDSGEFFSEATNKTVGYYTGNIFRYALMGTIVPSPTIMFEKEILRKIGFQNEKYYLCEEYEFILRICKYYDVAFINIPTYIHNYHAHQISRFNVEQLGLKRFLSMQIEETTTNLNAVVEWAYNDKEYYSNNKQIIDNRITELCSLIGLKWLEYGDVKEAREKFKCFYKFSHLKIKYLEYLVYCSMPSFIRPFVLRLGKWLNKRILLLQAIIGRNWLKQCK